MTTSANESEPTEATDQPDAATKPQASSDTSVVTRDAKPHREPDPRLKKLRWWLIATFAVLGILLVAVLIWTQFLPRWWANTIIRQTGGPPGSIGWGLAYGFGFTLVPVLLLGLAAFRPWKAPITRFVLAGLALLVALPNLITLSVSLAPGGANVIARTDLDLNAEWFRGSVLIGAIAAGVCAVLIGMWSIIQTRRNRELDKFRAEAKEAKEAAAEAAANDPS